MRYSFLLFKAQIYTDLRNTFSFSKNTFFLKKEPVLRKNMFLLVKLFFPRKGFVLKEKQISLAKLSFREAFLINLFLKGLKRGLC